MRPLRVRHHTNDEGLAGIQAIEGITVSRGWADIPTGVHVEVEPFRTTKPGLGGPARETASKGEGAYVEFDAPDGMVYYSCGPRNTAIIPVPLGRPFSLRGRNPVFVRIRRRWYEFWRTKPE